jgi:hypothetical protein
MKIPTCYLAVLLLLTGCATTFDKEGASEANFKQDLKLAKARARAEVENTDYSYAAFSIPAIIASHLIWKPIDKALLRKKLTENNMKKLGWEKQSNGRYTKTKSHVVPNTTQSTSLSVVD